MPTSRPDPIFTDADVAGLTMLLPTGVTAAVNPTDYVMLTLSTGALINIGTVTNLLKIMRKMRQEANTYIMPTEDVILWAAGEAGKLIVMESTFINQKLLNSFAGAVNAAGNLEMLGRSGSIFMSLDDALAVVGHYRTLSTPYKSDWDLQQPTGVHSPFMRVFDYKWAENAASTSQGTQFSA